MYGANNPPTKLEVIRQSCSPTCSTLAEELAIEAATVTAVKGLIIGGIGGLLLGGLVGYLIAK